MQMQILVPNPLVNLIQTLVLMLMLLLTMRLEIKAGELVEAAQQRRYRYHTRLARRLFLVAEAVPALRGKS